MIHDTDTDTVTFMELLERSVILQGTITLILVGALVYLYCTGQQPPSELEQLVFLALGFYFGGKIENSKMRTQITTKE